MLDLRPSRSTDNKKMMPLAPCNTRRSTVVGIVVVVAVAVVVVILVVVVVVVDVVVPWGVGFNRSDTKGENVVIIR